MLLDGHRLAREHRLIDLQVGAADEADIGWEHIAGRKLDDVSRHDLLDRALPRHRNPFNLAGHRRGCADEGGESFSCAA